MRALLVAAAVALLALPAPVRAQTGNARSYVSTAGSDNFECSRPSPCRTWNRAISVTTSGGEVSALDSGTYGDVSIDRSITLESVGVIATSLAGEGRSGVTINNPSARVVLRGLYLNGGADQLSEPGAFGVDIQAARTVRIQNLRIEEFPGAGIRFAASNSPARLTVLDTTIADNGGNGMTINAGTSGGAGTFTRATLRRVELVDNDFAGIASSATGSRGVSVSVFDTLIADNSAEGILSNGANSKVRVSDTDIIGNAHGLRALNGGALLSWGNNRVSANTIDGVPTGMIGTK